MTPELTMSLFSARILHSDFFFGEMPDYNPGKGGHSRATNTLCQQAKRCAQCQVEPPKCESCLKGLSLDLNYFLCYYYLDT